ncbi:MAG: hypothetical protein ACK559_15620, partial [bacterium]
AADPRGAFTAAAAEAGGEEEPELVAADGCANVVGAGEVGGPGTAITVTLGSLVSVVPVVETQAGLDAGQRGRRRHKRRGGRVESGRLLGGSSGPLAATLAAA